MNAFDLNQLIAQVAKEKGITQEKLQEALENAMLKAAKKVFGNHKAIESIYEDELGEIKLFHVIKIVGDEDEPLTEADFEDQEEEDESEEAHLIRREDRDQNIRQLTSSYEENQLHVDTAKREYALDLKVGQFIRLPILYQSELLDRQISAFKAERRSRRGSDREELDSQLRQLELRLSKEREEIKRYSERFGDLLLVDKEGRGFGRIAAQAAKGVIQDKIRQAERDKIFEDFNGREEIEVGVIRRFERGGGITVALTTPDQEQTVEALLPRREQIPHESYRPGQSIKCVIKSVLRDTKSAQIILSQRHENFIKKLFEQAVPEIYHGIVEIKGVARLFGEARGVKVAVNSKDPNVDAAGACIGPNGSRVKLVEAEIGGDKIEIVPFSSQAHIYVCNALQPAEVSRLLIDHDGNKMDVIVPDHQLSKAIGKRGKNVRLASLLTGWSLDIYSENKMKERESRIFELLSSQEGVRVEDLELVWEKTNLRSLDQIAFAELEDLGNIPASSAEGIIEAANELLNRRDAGEDIYHQTLQDFRERAWSSWPRADEVLTRELFERCHNIGIGMLSKLAAVEPELLSDRLRIDIAVAEEIYHAANQHLSS
jgi:N utilization substance protein A